MARYLRLAQRFLFDRNRYYSCERSIVKEMVSDNNNLVHHYNSNIRSNQEFLCDITLQQRKKNSKISRTYPSELFLFNLRGKEDADLFDKSIVFV